MFASLSTLILKEHAAVAHVLLAVNRTLEHDIAWAKALPIPLDIVLPLLGGICWSLAYILICWHSLREKRRIFIPILALSMNIVWEFIYSFIIDVPEEQEVIDHIWLGLDLFIIVFTWRNYLITRPQDQQGFQGFLQSFWYLVRNLLVGVFFNLVFVALVPGSSAFYGAFMINIVMSYLFIYGGGEAPNLAIAVLKMLGTALTSLYAYIYLVQTWFMVLTYILIFVLDCAYIFQVLRAPPKSKLA